MMRGRRPEFPTFVCNSVDSCCGHVCGLEARWLAPWSQDGQYVRVYCDGHRPEHATRIPEGARFQVTRLEVKVAVPHVPGDPFDAAGQAVRKVTNALESAGGLIVGVHIVRGRASQDGMGDPPLRLELAGRPEPARQPDRPLWDFPRVREWARPWRRTKTG